MGREISVKVPVSGADYEALLVLAAQECRTPPGQLLHLLRTAARANGVLCEPLPAGRNEEHETDGARSDQKLST